MGKRVVIALFCVVTLGPLLLGLGYSLLYSLGMIGLMNDGFTLAYWAELFQRNDALGSLWYSFWLTLVSLILILGLALWVSWRYLGRATSGRLYKLLFLPLLFPPLIAAFAWFYLLSPGGILARASFHIGLISGVEDFPRMVNDQFSIGILVTHIFLVFPLFTLLFIEQARKERMVGLLDMSRTLGSNRWQFFRKVYAPLLLLKSRPVIWLYGVFLLGTYEVPLLLGRSAPRTVSIFITEKLTKFDLHDIPVGHAMAVLYSVLVLVVITVFVRKGTRMV